MDIPLQEHIDAVLSVALSPDGRHIVSGLSDHTICIWDSQTGAQVGNPLKGHTSRVNLAVAFSPDGKYIVSGSSDHTICIWDAQTSSIVGNPLQGHTDQVWSVAFSPDGRHIVSGSSDHTVCIWDAQTGAQVDILQGHTSSVNSVTFSPDGRHIVSGSDDDNIQIWQVERNVEVNHYLGEHTQHLISFPPIYTPSSILSYIHNAKDTATISMVDKDCQVLGHGLHLKKNGWIIGQNGELLLWVPPSYHPFTWYTPWTNLIISCHPKLDLCRMTHGSAWAECFSSSTHHS